MCALKWTLDNRHFDSFPLLFSSAFFATKAHQTLHTTRSKLSPSRQWVNICEFNLIFFLLSSDKICFISNLLTWTFWLFVLPLCTLLKLSSTHILFVLQSLTLSANITQILLLILTTFCCWCDGASMLAANTKQKKITKSELKRVV